MPERTFRADLHIHTDGPFEDDGQMRHGLSPNDAAHAITNSGLDVVAISDHLSTSYDSFMHTRNSVAALVMAYDLDPVEVLLGVEMSLLIEGVRFHVGYVFEHLYGRQNWPAFPDRHDSVDVLEAFKKEYPGIAILNHPNSKKYPAKVIQYAMQHPLIDGAEVYNAAQMINPNPKGPKAALQDLAHYQCLPDALKKAAVGNSDAHYGGGFLIGHVWTEFSGGSAKDLFKRMQSGQTGAHASEEVLHQFREALSRSQVDRLDQAV